MDNISKRYQTKWQNVIVTTYNELIYSIDREEQSEEEEGQILDIQPHEYPLQPGVKDGLHLKKVKSKRKPIFEISVERNVKQNKKIRKFRK